jgi:hypothetical protein
MDSSDFNATLYQGSIQTPRSRNSDEYVPMSKQDVANRLLTASAKMVERSVVKSNENLNNRWKDMRDINDKYGERRLQLVAMKTQVSEKALNDQKVLSDRLIDEQSKLTDRVTREPNEAINEALADLERKDEETKAVFYAAIEQEAANKKMLAASAIHYQRSIVASSTGKTLDGKIDVSQDMVSSLARGGLFLQNEDVASGTAELAIRVARKESRWYRIFGRSKSL